MAYKNQALIYEIISPYGFHEKQISEVEKLAVSESGKYIASPDNKFRIIKYRSWLIISPVLSVAPSAIIISEEDKHIHFNSGALQLAVLPSAEYKKPGGSTVACLDMKLVRFPLLLRKWKTGDYFYPFGMKKVSSGKVGKKKISRFLMDIKLTKTEKEKIWVIESDKRILWVVGYRIDERFKITDSTKQFLRITLSQ
jgi:tRNA(Ile)-lysidine synthase